MALIKKTRKSVLKKPASAMKTMKKIKVSKIARGRGAKSKVLSGKKEKTIGGLTANDLFRNKRGRVVSRKLSAASKNHPWIKAVLEARKSLGITGFVIINKGQDGRAVYAKAKVIYASK